MKDYIIAHAKINQIFPLFCTIVLTFLIIGAITPGVMGTSTVDLGSAENFVILAKSGITTTGTTMITGNIGISPMAAGGVTGFGLVMDPSNQFSTSSLVLGQIYAANYESPTPAMLTTAVNNMETAYNEAAGQVPPNATELYAGNLGGRTLTPGVYKWSTGVLIPTSTDLTLDARGNESAVWIFQIAEDLTMEYASHVVLINGAKTANIYWQIAGATGVTIGPDAHVEGNILAQKAITMDSGASLQGRALAQTAVTLINNTIIHPHPSLTIFASSDNGGMITPAGNIIVASGGNQTFSCSAITGYQLLNLSIDGILTNANATYTFTNVTTSHTIRVLTTPIPTHFTANFTNSTTTGILPMNITFTDTSTGDPNWWSWNFGDDTLNVTTRNPIHTYTSRGLYQVTMSIGNSTTSQISAIRRNLTLIGKNPIISSFTINPVSGIAPLTVNFTDTSTGDDITNRFWNFGDGITGNGTTISHTYTNGGTYFASLTVTSLWDNSTTRKTIQVTNRTPIYFIINATSDAGGNISPAGFVNVLPGSNQTFIGNSLTGHEFHGLLIDNQSIIQASTYTFQNVTANHSIRVFTSPINPDFTAGFTNSTTIGLLPLLVQFTDTSSGLPDQWQWNFGDGTTNITSQNPSHTFSTSGSYPVTLTVGNTTCGRSSSYQRTLQIIGKLPVNASFTANQTYGPAPLTVQFNDTSTGDDLLVWNWIFGDNTSSTAQNPIHTYSLPGSYTVLLNVVSPFGSNTATKPGFTQVLIPVVTPIITATASTGGIISPAGSIPVISGGTQSFYATPSVGFELTDVTVDGASQGKVVAYTFTNVTSDHTINAAFRIIPPPSGKHTIIASSDRGSTIQPSGIIDIQIGGGQIFSIWPGANYQLNSVIVDGINHGPIRSYIFTNVTADHTISVNSSAVGLVADFIGSPLAGKSPLMVNFIDLSAGSPTSWFWRFGDGTFSSDQRPTHTFTRSGRYTVSLSVRNSGGSTIKTAQNYITISNREWVIGANSGQGGTITPSGDLSYPEGTSVPFTMRPSGGYRIIDLIVDGISTGPIAMYTFTNIVQSHTISAQFGLIGGDVPEITGVSPAQGQQGTIRQDVTITGKNFEEGARVFFTFGNENLTYATVGKSGQVLQVKELNLTAASVGQYDVQVMNPSGLQGSLPKAFTVTGPESKAPVVTGVNPISADNGAIIPTFIITGQNFGGTDMVDFISGGISALSLPAVIRGADLVIYNLSVARLYPGTFDIMVTNTTTGLKGTKYQTFSVVGNFSDSYVINATANEYAIIKPAGLITVKTGQSIEFTLQAKAGTGLSNLTVDSRQVPVPVNNRYSFSGVTANHAIHLKGVPSSGVILAGFRANVTDGSIPCAVQFTDTSSGNPTQWSWNFGDGQISTLQNPMHVYTRAGSFTVSLYARNSLSNNMKREKSFIHVNNAPTLVVNQVLSGGSSPVLPAGSMEIPGVVMPERRVLVPTFL